MDLVYPIENRAHIFQGTTLDASPAFPLALEGVVGVSDGV